MGLTLHVTRLHRLQTLHLGHLLFELESEWVDTYLRLAI